MSTSTPQSYLGRQAGSYRLDALLGEGGLAFVFRAHDTNLDVDVALKVLKPIYAHDSVFETGFRREAQIVAKLRHPNIIAIHTVDKVEAMVFFAMDLHERGVAELLSSGKPLGPSEVLNIGLDVAAALEFAHLRQVTHRDLKPANLRIDLHGNGIVTDFGIAQVAQQYEEATGTSVYVGTPRYMSPEQARGRRVDGRSDLYSLGVTLYHMLTGAPPFDGGDWYELGRRHIEEAPRPLCEKVPGIDPLLEGVVLRCLAKEPEERYQSATEVIAALHAVGQGDAALASGTRERGASTRSRRMATAPRSKGATAPGRRRMAQAGGMLLAGLAVVTGIVAGVRACGARSVRPLYVVNADPSSFYTERLAPDSSGMNGEVNLNVSAPLDGATVSPATVAILGPNGQPVPASVSVPDGTTIRIRPIAVLPFGAACRVRMESGVRGQNGEKIVERKGSSVMGASLGFRTGERPVLPERSRGARPKPAMPSPSPSRAPGSLDITVLPTGAEVDVYINGERCGRAPITGKEIPSGKPTIIELYGVKSGSGYRVRLLQETLAPSSGQKVTFRRTVPAFASITVASNPPGRVFIDNVDTGEETPLAGYILKAGRHTLQIKPMGASADQYRSILEEFVLPEWTWGYKLGPYALEKLGAPSKL